MAEQHSSGYKSDSKGGSSPRKRRRKRRSIAGTVFSVLGTLLLVFIITCSFIACFAAVYIKNVIIPMTPLDVGDFPTNLSSTIYYIDQETGEEVVYETLHGDENRVQVAYDDIPDYLIKAAVAIEDRRFYTHHGVDWIRTGKAILTMFTGGQIQGGSTITQQTIKNMTQHDDVTVKRKIVEIFQALEFDKKYSKEKTLEEYLNRIYFGRQCYGVYTASYMYFGKDLSELDLAECASLISITNNPSLYDPYTNLEKNTERRGYVLDAMLRDGYITEEECEAAKAEVIDFHSGQKEGQTSTLYSWYTEQVITDVTNDLMEEYGYSLDAAERIVYNGGLKIVACVDPKVQAAVDAVYSDTENLPYTSKSGQQLQSAITVIDTKGNVVALAGKMGEKTASDTRGWNMATMTQRQPGSSIKPLAVYAPAIEMGLITPYTVMEDSAVMLLNETAWPSNVDRRYRGQVTVMEAVTHSYNTIAVRTLQAVTPAVGYEYLVTKFGVDLDHLVVDETINGKVYTDVDYSPLALGGLTNGLTTLDMAGAYSVFQSNGIYIKPRTYSLVEDTNGKPILTQETTAEPVLKQSTVYYINQMLQNVVKNGSGKAAQMEGMSVAGKTGTTSSDKDRWFVGYTPYYTAAVWVGYSTPETITGPSSMAINLWKGVMSQIHEGLEDIGFPTASGLVQAEYCKDSGKLATEACYNDIRGSRVATGYYFPEDVPTDYCEAHTMVEVCTESPILDANGQPTDRYHLAGEFCPEVTVDEDGNASLGRISVSVLNMPRQYVGEQAPEDELYSLASLEAEGFCTVHTEPVVVEPEPYDPSIFDITNPTTWPTAEQDPNFDPSDSATWPGNSLLFPPAETNEPVDDPNVVPSFPPVEESDPPVVTPPPVYDPETTPDTSQEPTFTQDADIPFFPQG